MTREPVSVAIRIVHPSPKAFTEGVKPLLE